MTPEEREAILAAHALGSLSAPDAADAERLIRTDEFAAAEYIAFREIADLISLSVPLRRADPDLRRRVLAAARRSPRIGRAPIWRRWMPAAALAAALVIAMWWGASLHGALDELRRDTAMLAAIVEADAKRVELLSSQAQQVSESGIRFEAAIREQQTLLELQSDPDVLKVEFKPTWAAHGASGYYLWSDSAKAGVLIVHNLPPLPFGQVYKVWAEDQLSRRVLLTTFTPDARGSQQVMLTAESGSNPLTLYIVGGGSLQGSDGPIVLEAKIVRKP